VSTDGPDGPRPRRGTVEQTRRRLVAAAAAAFERDGYEQTNTNRIAREAGYAPGTFYKHFPDKLAAFAAVYEEWVAEEWRGIGEIAAGEPDVGLRARAIVDWIVEHHRRWRGLRRSLRRLAAEDGALRDAWLGSRSRQLDALGSAGLGSREEAALLLYAVERTADALADGEDSALGLERERLVAGLAERLAEQLATAISGRGR